MKVNMIGLNNQEFAKELNRRRGKGIVVNYVARAKQPLPTVAKTLKTYLREGYLTGGELILILDAVKIETVLPFADKARFDRYEQLRKELCI